MLKLFDSFILQIDFLALVQFLLATLQLYFAVTVN